MGIPSLLAKISPNSWAWLNERLYFPETKARLKILYQTLDNDYKTVIYVESVGYQRSLPQDLRTDGFPAEEFEVHGQDKRMRLSMVTQLIQDLVQFPEQGAETLIQQLIGFGVERHDDLADAFAIALYKAREMMTSPKIIVPKLPESSQKPVPIAHLKEIEKAELWLADREAEYKQGQMSHVKFLDAQEVVWWVKSMDMTLAYGLGRTGWSNKPY